MTGKYTLEEIKAMIKLGRINASNIKDVLICLKNYANSSEIRNILTELSNNPSVPEDIREDVKEIINEVPKETINPIEEIIKPTEEVVEPVEEEKKEEIVPEVQQPVIKPVDIASKSGDTISLDNDFMLGTVASYAASRGLKVLSSNPGIVENGEISFELNYESKPYIDNLLLSLYGEMDDVKVGMKKIASSGKEVLTLSVDNPELSQSEIMQKSNEMFAKVNEILQNTDKNKDYEEKMDPKLKALKDKFHNDDPNIPNEDFEIGYSRKAGENTYYIVADSKQEAIEAAELMGYEIKEDRGGNVFEIKDENVNMEGSKLDVAATRVNELDSVKDVDDGLTDIDVDFNNTNFINNDYLAFENMTRYGSGEIRVSTPTATSSQRVVEVSNNSGETNTFVFDNGAEFDNYAAKFENTTVATNDGYYNSNEVELETPQMNPVNGETTEYEYGNKSYVKSLGTHPSMNNSQAANTNFWALIIFILVLVIGCGIIYLVFR